MTKPLTKAERDEMRQWLSDHWSPGESGRWAKLLDAADALDAVKAENEIKNAALREAIDRLYRERKGCDCWGKMTGQCHRCKTRQNVENGCRAALNPDPEAKK